MNCLVSPLNSTSMMGLVALSMILKGQSAREGRKMSAHHSRSPPRLPPPPLFNYEHGEALTLHVGLDLSVGEPATNEAFGVEDGAEVISSR